ncbi:hypothetical protein L6164_008653 [Bauhinia variegata]|uniref:Uncharacterized protein n=1 Tax=Bauhinia variegata TaxID=167791 RepID=A0ACB9PHE5_BAUVA|nr:hypothetical protein L6164_008653 [Bauhinia variegata]
MGYMAPEYGLEGIVSMQIDVYSYGILLMKTFTGKKPTDEMFRGEFSIKKWVKDFYPDAIIDVIGGQLLAEERRQLAIKKDCLLSIIALALECSTDSPNERRNMNEVLAALKKIRTKFLNEP